GQRPTGEGDRRRGRGAGGRRDRRATPFGRGGRLAPMGAARLRRRGRPRVPGRRARVLPARTAVLRRRGDRAALRPAPPGGAVGGRVGEEIGARPRWVEGAGSRRWVLLDYGDVVVHVFLAEEREYYRLERLYSDAAVIERP